MDARPTSGLSGAALLTPAWRTAAWLVVLAVALIGQPLRAQTVVGRVTEAATGAPVPAALVELLDAEGAQWGATLTGPDGRYALTASAPGTYTLRLRRLGFATTSIEAVEVVGTQRLDVEVATQPVQLDGLVATARNLCIDGPGIGPATEQLWDLVAGALGVVRVAQEMDRYRFDMLLYMRNRTLDQRHLLVDVVERAYESGPFVAIPIERLEEQGYVEVRTKGLIEWYMPDPGVLVSDHFRETHCFRVVDGDQPNLVGLGFEPTPERLSRRADDRNDTYEELFGRDVVEISGVLWVDRETGALRDLEYGYVGIEDPEIRRLAEGWARFEQLVGGLWIVRQWQMAIPNLQLTPERLVPASTTVTGGHVVHAFDDGTEPGVVRGAEALAEAEGGDIRGRLVAGDVPVSVAYVEVRLSGSSRAVVTNPDGEFFFQNVPPGKYAVTWSSSELSGMGIPPRAVDVSIEAGVDATVRLPGPSWDFVAEYLCPNTRLSPGEGIVRVAGPGTTYDRSDGVSYFMRTMPIWSGDPNVDFSMRVVPVNGAGTFCGVPMDLPLVAQTRDSVPPIAIAPGRGLLSVTRR